MNITTPISRRLAAGLVTATAVAGLTVATPAAGTTQPADERACTFDQGSLPRTPDAVEGWYAHCRARLDVATGSGLPRTADAVEAWTS